MLVMSSSNYILSLFKNYACGIITQTKRKREKFFSQREGSWLTSLSYGFSESWSDSHNIFYWQWWRKEFAILRRSSCTLPQRQSFVNILSNFISTFASANSKALKFPSFFLRSFSHLWRKRLVINWINSISNFLPSKWAVSNLPRQQAI